MLLKGTGKSFSFKPQELGDTGALCSRWIGCLGNTLMWTLTQGGWAKDKVTCGFYALIFFWLSCSVVRWLLICSPGSNREITLGLDHSLYDFLDFCRPTPCQNIFSGCCIFQPSSQWDKSLKDHLLPKELSTKERPCQSPDKSFQAECFHLPRYQTNEYCGSRVRCSTLLCCSPHVQNS